MFKKHKKKNKFKGGCKKIKQKLKFGMTETELDELCNTLKINDKNKIKVLC